MLWPPQSECRAVTLSWARACSHMVCSPSVNDEPSRPRDKPQLEFLASAIDGKITRSRYLHSYIRDRTPRNNNGQPDDKIAASYSGGSSRHVSSK